MPTDIEHKNTCEAPTTAFQVTWPHLLLGPGWSRAISAERTQGEDEQVLGPGAHTVRTHQGPSHHHHLPTPGLPTQKWVRIFKNICFS